MIHPKPLHGDKNQARLRVATRTRGSTKKYSTGDVSTSNGSLDKNGS